MFSKIKKVLVSLVLVASLALAPMSNVSAGGGGPLPIEQYDKIEMAMSQLEVTYDELTVLAYLNIVPYGMICNCDKRPINKSRVATEIDRMLGCTPPGFKAYVTANKYALRSAYAKISGELPGEQDGKTMLAMKQLGLTFPELAILNSLHYVTRKEVCECDSRPIHKSSLVKAIDGLIYQLEHPFQQPAMYISSMQMYTSNISITDLSNIRDKITKKLQDEPDENPPIPPIPPFLKKTNKL